MLGLGPENGGLVLTIGKYVRPSGASIDRHDSPGAESSAGIAPDPGLEMIVEGEEYDAWSAETNSRDQSIQLEPQDLPPPHPDRVLERAVELLSATLANRP